MARFRGQRQAFGAPGFEARWTDADKDGIGTSFSNGGRVWFTIRRGILTEVFYPTVDCPQVRDLEFLFADGDGLFLEEKRDLEYTVRRLGASQGYRVTSHDRDQRLSVTKEIIVDPSRPCVLLNAKIETSIEGLKTYVLCAPHLENGGSGNNAFVVEVSGRELLVAEKEDRWLALGVSTGFTRLSCGYVGSSDGYTDLAQHRQMDFEFDEARDGNVALTGQIHLTDRNEFTIGLALGETLPSVVSTLFQALGIPFAERRRSFLRYWQTAAQDRKALDTASGDKGHLFRASYDLLLSHEDKIYQGAFVASLSIPWGEARDDDEGRDGYHLVWTRDMVESAMGLLAAGNTAAPLRALIYLAARQEEDGGFPQNFWVNGDPFRRGTQLDETAFPVMLAWRMNTLNLLREFDPLVMVRRAVTFLLHQGPVTGEERWEEASGYSPSTLAAIISAFVCAAAFLRVRKEEETATFLESYADFLRAHLEEWTVTTKGSVVPGFSRYYVRLNPMKPGEAARPGSVDQVSLEIANQAPGAQTSYPARDVVDAGFLQLIRYGIVGAHDAVVVDSVQVVDNVLKTNTPEGPCWHRYNHDGYGQRPDGGAYITWGCGRVWPLLTGERGHYELAAGQDAKPYLRAMERFATGAGLLAEQLWDEDRPDLNVKCGGLTGAANPLLWAHSEYMRLLRSYHDRNVFDLIPEVATRYQGKTPTSYEFWQPRHPIAQARKGHTLRICTPAPFRLHWSHAGNPAWQDSDSRDSGIGAQYVDIPATDFDPWIEFTLYWKERGTWEGNNYRVEAY